MDAIIQLPSNLFLNVTISVDIMLLKKNKTDNAVLFVDASKEFVKVTKNNRLSEDNIRRIVSAVAERKDEPHFARLVPNDEVSRIITISPFPPMWSRRTPGKRLTL